MRIALGFLLSLAPVLALLAGGNVDADAVAAPPPPATAEAQLRATKTICLTNYAADAVKSVPGGDELCTQCGHLFNSHRLLGYGNPPTEGWMECPVEGCMCRMTWSTDPKAPEHIKKIFAVRSEEGDA